MLAPFLRRPELDEYSLFGKSLSPGLALLLLPDVPRLTEDPRLSDVPPGDGLTVSLSSCSIFPLYVSSPFGLLLEDVLFPGVPELDEEGGPGDMYEDEEVDGL